MHLKSDKCLESIKFKCTYSSERSLNIDNFFSLKKKLNDYVYNYGPKNIQSVIKYSLLFNLLKEELII